MSEQQTTDYDPVWIECWMCGGIGEHDGTDSDPLEGDPQETCPECHGLRGWWGSYGDE